MRYIDPTQKTYLEGTVQRLALCLKMTRRDGTEFGFTSHDRDMDISGVTYRAAVGFACSSLRWTAQLEDERTTLEGLLSGVTGGIRERDARMGLYNEALCELFLVRWDTATLIVPLKRGRLSSLTPQGGSYTAEIRSLLAPLLKKRVVLPVTLDCTAELGDARCAVAPVAYYGTATKIDSRTVQASGFSGPVDPSDLIGGRFLLGGGLLDWFVNQVKSYNAGTQRFTLAVPFPSEINFSGDDFTVYEGCNKKFATCKDRFNNVLNFRGFHFTPDKGKLSKHPVLSQGGYQTPGGS